MAFPTSVNGQITDSVFQPAVWLPITTLYASLCALILIWLTYKAGSMRGRKKISLGDNNDPEMLEAIRGHGNAVENIPIALILIGLMELHAANGIFLHVLGLLLVVSRIAHPLGLKADNIGHPLRAVGAGGTLLVIVIAAVYSLWQLIKSSL